MGLVSQVYNKLGEITTLSNNHPNRADFEYWLNKGAWFAAQDDHNQQGTDYYWGAAKAFFTLNFLVRREQRGSYPIIDVRDMKNSTQFATLDPIGDLDDEDRAIIDLGLRHALLCSVDAPAPPKWWTSRRELVGLEPMYQIH